MKIINAMLGMENMKYLGTLDHPIAKMLMENARNGTEILLKPKFFSTWDFGKAQ